MPRKATNILTGIEIGSSTIKVVIGEFTADGGIRVAGLAEIPAMKVLKGEITDNNIVHEQLVQALGQAERQAGMDIRDVYLVVSCGNVSSINSMGSFAASGPEQTILERDVTNALENAKAHVLPPDKMVLHTIDRRYIVDAMREVSNPVNQIGQKLSVDVHIIYGQYNSIENLCRLVDRTMGYSATDICFSGVAAAYGALSHEEMERGSLVIDIGAGTSKYIVFHGVGVFHSGQVSIGADHVANDLAVGTGAPILKARKIVENLAEYEASAVMTADGHYRQVRLQVGGLGTQAIPTSTIEQVIELRLKELFEIILRDLKKQKALPRIATGITLVGGGALIHGIDELAKRVFNLPVRIGRPHLVSSVNHIADSPKYVTPIGLLRWGQFVNTIVGVRPPFLEQVFRDVGGGCHKIWRIVRDALKW